MSGQDELRAQQNTDRELYREPKGDLPSDYYANSVHVAEDGRIGMNVGGRVVVASIAEWHAALWDSAAALAAEREAGRREALAEIHREANELRAAWPVELGGAARSVSVDRQEQP